jgi:RimJ/RimL family protein N-acetyltransferase
VSVPPILTARLRLEFLSAPLARAILSRRRAAGWAEGFPTSGEVRAATWVVGDEAFERRPHPFLPFVLRERDSGLLIGGAGFHGAPRERIAELGYGLVPRRRGRGYATEACCALVEAALATGLVDAVVASTDPTNAPSQAVLARAGFVATNEAGTFWVRGADQPTSSSRN